KSKASYYVWLDDLPIAQIDLAYNFAGTVVDSTTLTYLHSDHLNTPRLATNQSGNLVWSWQSDAFGIGQPKTHGSTIDVILRFPGQIADAHSGLYYNYFRDYDPETGRYVESDPIGLDGGLNTYGYVEGNPLRSSDPDGLFARTAQQPLGVRGVGVMPGMGGLITPISAYYPSIGQESNVVPLFPPPKQPTGQCSKDDPNGDDGCYVAQKSLLATRAFILELYGLSASEQDVAAAQSAITRFNQKASIHNQRCPNYKVPPIRPILF
ncbi:RHS repeat domain-containing protein, partial [Pseudomonas sp. 1D4]|uniref:RHS repeat domain-containing protein n=2 Tax=Pseudomonadaceae TaxID=135621 RepID=UPI000A4A8ABC